MSYLDNFEHSFMRHTLRIVEEYKGSYDATVLINCLLGLLVIPKEKFLKTIPEDPISELNKWGINPESIKSISKPNPKNPRPDTIRGLVYNLRNSVAHFRLEPIPRTEEVHSFKFTDESGLEAIIKIDEMRTFVRKLAEHLDRH